MKEYPFEHDGPVYSISDDEFEVVYYSCDGRKYKRIRLVAIPDWSKATEYQISNDVFYMTIACIERSNRRASK